jgi:WD40 repeat protein
VSLWDLASRKLLTTFRLFTNNVGAWALSPNGQYLAAADQNRLGFYSTVLALWDISARPQAPQMVWSHPVDGALRTMTFSPDGQVLVTARAGSNIVIQSWESKTGHELKAIPNASAGFIAVVAFSPDGTLLASSGVEGPINVWDFTSRTLKFPLDGHSDVESLVFSPDGAQLYALALRHGHGPGGFLAMAPDGTFLVSKDANDSVKIWRAPSLEEIDRNKTQ